MIEAQFDGRPNSSAQRLGAAGVTRQTCEATCATALPLSIAGIAKMRRRDSSQRELRRSKKTIGHVWL